MVTDQVKPASFPSDIDEQDVPLSQPSASTSTTSASTATAPSYSPIYATAKPTSMTVPELPTPDIAGGSTTITAPTESSTATSTPASPPQPQPGVVPVAVPTTTTATATAPISPYQQKQDPGDKVKAGAEAGTIARTEDHSSPPMPTPAPKRAVTSTPAPVLQTQTREARVPLSTNPNHTHSTNPNHTHPPAIITAAPAYPPASAPAPTSTSIYTTGGPHSAQPLTTTATTLVGAYSCTPGSGPSSSSGKGTGIGTGYNYIPQPDPGYSNRLQQMQHKQQQQSQYHGPTPNSTTTPYASVYAPPSASTSTALPLHNATATGSNIVTCEEERGGEGGLWESTKLWLQSAGNRLAQVEAEVWRRINEAHDGDNR
ncbi:hypothetical protein BDW66DRAFT_87449 [Aspergillus desertorum]